MMNRARSPPAPRVARASTRSPRLDSRDDARTRRLSLTTTRSSPPRSRTRRRGARHRRPRDVRPRVRARGDERRGDDDATAPAAAGDLDVANAPRGDVARRRRARGGRRRPSEVARDAQTRRATRAEDGERLQGGGDEIDERERERAKGSQSSKARAVGEGELEDATGDKRRSPREGSARAGKLREEAGENSGAGGERRDARGRVRRRRGARGRVVLSA